MQACQKNPTPAFLKLSRTAKDPAAAAAASGPPQPKAIRGLPRFHPIKIKLLTCSPKLKSVPDSKKSRNWGQHAARLRAHKYARVLECWGIQKLGKSNFNFGIPGTILEFQAQFWNSRNNFGIPSRRLRDHEDFGSCRYFAKKRYIYQQKLRQHV